LRSHGDRLDDCPVDDELKAKLTTDWRTINLSETNRLILGYAETITNEAYTIDQSYIDHLKRSGLTDQMLHDVTAVAAYFAFINRLADALGVELEGSYKG
jgi:alkylhydroperoxidase family enzyme